MALMTWTPELSVGIASIDEQHKKLIAMLNDLHEGMSSGQGRAALGPVLEKLVSYTVEHFQYEESLFAKTGYGDTAAHKVEHEKLKAQAIDIQKRYESSTTGALSLEVLNFLRSWLTNHIKGTDKKYSQHLAANGVT